MKAVYIPDNITDLTSVNQNLKDCTGVIQTISMSNGTILICENYTRRDKIVEIQKKVDEYE